VPSLPEGTVEIELGESVYQFYAGTFYVLDSDDGDFVVIQAPEGAVVPYLPDDHTEQTRNGVLYYKYAGVYYQPKSSSGVIAYEVVII
jgi:hypothetical protein